MITAVDPKASWEYIAKEDRESDDPTIWILRGMTAREVQKIEDQGVSFDDKSRKIGVLIGTKGLLYLRRGLMGVQNFRDASGNEIEFKAERVGLHAGTASDDFLDLIPVGIRNELIEEIQGKSKIGSDELGN
jgi:hypothetical protein